MTPDHTAVPRTETDEDDPLALVVPQGVFIEWEDGSMVRPLALTYTGERRQPDGRVLTIWTAYVPTEAREALESGRARLRIAMKPAGSDVVVEDEDQDPDRGPGDHPRGDTEFMDHG